MIKKGVTKSTQDLKLKINQQNQIEDGKKPNKCLEPELNDGHNNDKNILNPLKRQIDPVMEIF